MFIHSISSKLNIFEDILNEILVLSFYATYFSISFCKRFSGLFCIRKALTHKRNIFNATDANFKSLKNVFPNCLSIFFFILVATVKIFFLFFNINKNSKNQITKTNFWVNIKQNTKEKKNKQQQCLFIQYSVNEI